MDQRLLERAVGEGRIRGIGLEIWASAREVPERAGGVISRGLREARALHSRERRLVSELLYDLVRHREVLIALLGSEAPRQLWTGALVWRGLPADLARQALPEVEAARWEILAEGLEASRARAVEGLDPEEALARIAGVPAAVARELLARFGPEARAFVDASNDRAPVALRARDDREALVAQLAAEGVEATLSARSPRGLRVVGRTNLQANPSFRRGLFEVQDEGSQRLADLVQPVGTVIDLCAGAGGKTLALAGPDVRLVAADVRPRALDNLRKRAARAGLRVTTHLLDGQGLPPALARLRADRVLVDAPCSGTGTWRRNPALRWRLQPERRAELRALQADLLAQAATLVKPGGRLIYGTCSVLPSENEAIAEAFTASHPEFTPLPAGQILAGQGEYLRLSPHRDDTDGFFGAVWGRVGG